MLILLLAASATALATGLGAVPVFFLGGVRRSGSPLGLLTGAAIMLALATALSV